MHPVFKARLDYAVALAESLGDCFGRFIISGGTWIAKGSRQNKSEAGVGSGYLQEEFNISADKIRVEDKSRTTVENAVNLYRQAEQLELCEFVVVTSWSHRRRARKIFERVFGRKVQVRSSSLQWKEWKTLLLSPLGWLVSNLELLKLKYKAL